MRNAYFSHSGAPNAYFSHSEAPKKRKCYKIHAKPPPKVYRGNITVEKTYPDGGPPKNGKTYPRNNSPPPSWLAGGRVAVVGGWVVAGLGWWLVAGGWLGQVFVFDYVLSFL